MEYQKCHADLILESNPKAWIDVMDMMDMMDVKDLHSKCQRKRAEDGIWSSVELIVLTILWCTVHSQISSSSLTLF